MSKINVSVDCVIFGFDNEEKKLKVLLIKKKINPYDKENSKKQIALPGDLIRLEEDIDLVWHRLFPSTYKCFPRNFQFHLLQRFGPEQAPIVFRYTKACHAVRLVVFAVFQVTVQRCALGHIDSLHGDHIQTENFASSKAYDETLHLLAVNGVGPGLDAQRVVGARKTQHFFHFRVECYAVGVVFFKQQLFCFQIVHQTSVLFVNHRQFTFGHGQIKASDTTLDVANQQNWKWVVHEHFVNRTIFQANQHPFAAIGASNDFYVSNDRFHDPLSLLLARKGEQLQLLFLA